jgi:uncharacterized protein
LSDPCYNSTIVIWEKRVDILYFFGMALTGYVSGLLGALLGLGGGVFIVAALRLIFGVPFLMAVGTSNMAVIATSTGGAATYVRNGLANIRLALILLVSTTSAALAASLLASLVPVEVLSALFAAVVVYAAISVRRKERQPDNSAPVTEQDARQEENTDRLGLGGVYNDAAAGRAETYTPRRIGGGMGVSAFAGVVAGLLGVGGGIVQMPVMNLLMGVPLKVATGTSSFMIGITATSAAIVRYARGDIDPLMAVPIVLFVFLGARTGAWLVPRTPNALLRQIFSWVAFVIAGMMILQALGIYGE